MVSARAPRVEKDGGAPIDAPPSVGGCEASRTAPAPSGHQSRADESNGSEACRFRHRGKECAGVRHAELAEVLHDLLHGGVVQAVAAAVVAAEVIDRAA